MNRPEHEIEIALHQALDAAVALGNEVNQLKASLDSAEERSKACDQIAEGEEGWQALRDLCVATMSVAELRDRYERLQATLMRYGKHDKECRFKGISIELYDSPCTCGLFVAQNNG